MAEARRPIRTLVAESFGTAAPSPSPSPFLPAESVAGPPRIESLPGDPPVYSVPATPQPRRT